MASHLMDMNIFFQKNMSMTDPNHNKHSKMTTFWLRFNTGKNRHCFGGMQPEAQESATRKKRHLSLYHVYSAALASIVGHRALW